MNNSHKLVIATDLDGTFLEGDLETKNFFYNKMMQLQEHILLVYVTGRPVHTVVQFCQQGYLPPAHYIIGDHGTHIVDGVNFTPVSHLQDPIIKLWNNGNELLKDLLKDEPGIQLQPIDPPYRVAYYYEENEMQPETLHKIKHAGYDAILSCDAYLDIVPRNVNKGTTLVKLLESLNISHLPTVTCGDSMNDLSLFQTGLPSIAVGNSEPKLVQEIQNLKNVYHSAYPGLLGILDGLGYYDLLKHVE